MGGKEAAAQRAKSPTSIGYPRVDCAHVGAITRDVVAQVLELAPRATRVARYARGVQARETRYARGTQARYARGRRYAACTSKAARQMHMPTHICMKPVRAWGLL